jgi:hypothetical protein
MGDSASGIMSMVQGGGKGGAKGGAGGGKPSSPGGIVLQQVGKAMAAGGRSETESAGKYAEHIHPVEYRTGGKIRKAKRTKAEDRIIPKRKKAKRVGVHKVGMSTVGGKKPDKKRKKERKDSSR